MEEPTIVCPRCQSANHYKKKLSTRGVQIYYCKDCKRQFLEKYLTTEERSAANRKIDDYTIKRIRQLKAQNLSIKLIAQRLQISVETVRFYLNHPEVSSESS